MSIDGDDEENLSNILAESDDESLTISTERSSKNESLSNQLSRLKDTTNKTTHRRSSVIDDNMLERIASSTDDNVLDFEFNTPSVHWEETASEKSDDGSTDSVSTSPDAHGRNDYSSNSKMLITAFPSYPGASSEDETLLSEILATSGDDYESDGLADIMDSHGIGGEPWEVDIEAILDDVHELESGDGKSSNVQLMPVPAENSDGKYNIYSALECAEDRERTLSLLGGPGNAPVRMPLHERIMIQSGIGSGEATTGTVGNETILDDITNSKSPGSIGRTLYVEPLTTISHLISTDEARGKIGIQSCFCIHFKFIAIGCSRGYILVFDHFQSGTRVIGDSKNTKNDIREPVTSLDFSSKADHLLAGYRNGHLILWDVNTGNALKSIFDESSKPAPVCFVKHLPVREESIWVYSNSHGAANVLSFHHRLFVWTSTIESLFSGTTALALSVLQPTAAPHRCNSYVLAGVSTAQMTFIISVKPTAEIFFKRRRPSDIRDGSIPYHAWRRVVWKNRSEGGSSKGVAKMNAMDPVFTVGWDRRIELVRILPAVPYSDTAPFEFPILCDWNTDAEICGIEWLSEQIIVYLNANQEIRVLNPFVQQELESVYIGAMGLVPHRFFRDKFGEKELSYHNSFQTCDNILYMLGSESMQTVKVFAWDKRLEMLTSNEDDAAMLDGLSLALAFFEGCAPAPVGLPRSLAETQAMMLPTMKKLIIKYLDCVIPLNGDTKKIPTTPSKRGEIIVEREVYETIAAVCVDFLLACASGGKSVISASGISVSGVDGVTPVNSLEMLELLYTDAFLRMKSVDHVNVFLEVLETYVVNERASVVKKDVLEEYVNLCEIRGRPRSIERFIISLDPLHKWFDSKYVLRICRKHRLYSALIYVSNRALNDFSGPLEEIIRVLEAEVAKLEVLNESLSDNTNNSAISTDADVYLINARVEDLVGKIMLYISMCFTGKLFLRGGLLPTDRAQAVRRSILNTLFNGVSSDHILQFLAVQIGMKDFLKVISLGLEPIGIIGVVSKSQDPALNAATIHGTVSSGIDNDVSTSSIRDTPTSAFMINKLNSIVVDMSIAPYTSRSTGYIPINDQWPFSAMDQGIYFSQLATWISQGFLHCDSNDNKSTCSIDSPIFDRLMSYLAIGVPAYDQSTAAARQDLLLSLIMSQSLESYNVSKLFDYAEGARFFSVCAALARLRGDFSRMVKYAARITIGGRNGSDVFPIMHRVLSDKNETEAIKEDMRRALVSNLANLVAIDSDATADLIIEYCAKDHDKVLLTLARYPKLQYRYLRSVLDPDYSRKVQLEKLGVGANNDAATRNIYLQLMCEVDKRRVLEYLRSNSNFVLSDALTLVRKYNIYEAETFLLERTGDVSGAMDVCIRRLKNAIETMSLSMLGSPSPGRGTTNENSDNRSPMLSPSFPVPASPGTSSALDPRCTEEVQRSLSQGLEFCDSKWDQENPDIWFRLTDALLFYQRSFKKRFSVASNRAEATRCGAMNIFLNDLLQECLHTMLQRVPLTRLIEKMVSDQGARLEEYRGTLEAVVAGFSYERNVLITVNEMLGEDHYRLLTEQVSLSTHAVVSDDDVTCHVCSQPVYPSVNAIIYACGHTEHSACQFTKVCSLCLSGKAMAESESLRNAKSSSLTETKPVTGVSNSQLTAIMRRMECCIDRDKSAKRMSRYEQWRKSTTEPSLKA